MTIGLTSKQAELLAFIERYMAEHGIAPSFDEMGVAIGYRSKSGTFRLLAELEGRGRIRRLPGRQRAIEVIAPAPAVSITSDHTGIVKVAIDARITPEWLARHEVNFHAAITSAVRERRLSA